ncbi:PREDICTED: uncharacterized protein LOC105954903 [Erythranthe guttata]|uniref:uncharacterized protein LOC105954903 n=1 Tax=Erythranthe guttata TaxID=4155 RepID=UPI00064DF9FC|nr:PREDICTED: uncharacterized protein LOC105954903 [Erythranthe guttata]XP_012834041.1 PREDICTED: uncharacterized protein LOC105954903 [Erythranthe guttata]|eukprot:XP_012834040.1 PREDICTED: uncharacterized protein LOC105954903 [Erythranthe guttata]
MQSKLNHQTLGFGSARKRSSTWNSLLDGDGSTVKRAVVWLNRLLTTLNRGDVSSSDSEEGTSTSTGGTTMERIVEKLKKFDYKDDIDDESEGTKGVIEKGSIEDIFHVEE